MSDLEKILITMLEKNNEKQLGEIIVNIFQEINEINLKINRITNKFDYLIELLEYIGDDEDNEENDKIF